MPEAVDVATHCHLRYLRGSSALLHSIGHRKDSKRLPELALALPASVFILIDCMEACVLLDVIFDTVVFDRKALVILIVVLFLIC